MAKGRLLGIQFYELFKDNLYFEIGKKTIELALYVKEELKKKGVKLFIDSYTNQQFIIITKEKYDEISKKFVVSYGMKMRKELFVEFAFLGLQLKRH